MRATDRNAHRPSRTFTKAESRKYCSNQILHALCGPDGCEDVVAEMTGNKLVSFRKELPDLCLAAEANAISRIRVYVVAGANRIRGTVEVKIGTTIPPTGYVNGPAGQRNLRGCEAVLDVDFNENYRWIASDMTCKWRRPRVFFHDDAFTATVTAEPKVVRVGTRYFPIYDTHEAVQGERLNVLLLRHTGNFAVYAAPAIWPAR